ncbi:UNVERIFIED_CONTAM: Myb family transcription factor PHL8 [Sesamum latifolium]|uniref:Myb family transcription factor PHL8 n=1 Tax=Sesamum latifolium TaxID=2727402 RepID=A0AAW2X4M3_9LAMI
MAFQNVHGDDMSLVLSSDAKPRLKWTQELHQRGYTEVFDEGHGHSWTHFVPPQEPLTDYGGKKRNLFASTIFDGAKEPTNENLQITQALQMQMEVQRKLHEQIEVQRHLQLRIEAQGKYLQSVLRKAQETLSEYSSCSIEAERAKAQLSQLASMVDSRCPSSSFSVLTQSESSIQDETELQHEVDEYYKHENGKTNNETTKSIELSLMEMHPVEKGPSEIQAINSEKSGVQSSYQQVNRISLFKDIDLNYKSMNDFGSGPRTIDLNDKGVELFNGNF